MNPPESLKLVACGRLSTAAQLDGYGEEIQTSDMRRWARSTGHRLHREIMFDKAVSGTTDADDRPELSKALNLLAAGKVDGLLFPNVDRVARELTVQEATFAVIWAHGGRVFTVDRGELLPDDDSDPMRTFVRQVMGAAAQLERGLIVKRLRSGLQAKRAAGGYAGGAPAYGMRAVDAELQPDPEESLIVARIKAMRDRGLSLRAIASRLNADQVPTKRGGTWQAATVGRIVNPATRAADAERAVDRYAAKKAEKRITKARKLLSRHTSTEA